MTVSPRIRRYDHVLLDLDGCLWVGEDACEGAVEAVQALREAGANVLFLTNDVRHAPEDFVRKLWRLGFQASLAEVVTVGAALQYQLASRDRASAYVVGSQALVDHVAEAGLRILNRTPFATRADVVVVGAHDEFVYDELRIASQAVIRGAELIGATRDATFPMPDGPWPGTGADPGRDRERRRPQRRPRGREARARDVRGRPRPARPGPHAGRRRPARRRRRRRAPCRDRLGFGADRRDDACGGRRGRSSKPTHVADSLAALVLGTSTAAG